MKNFILKQIIASFLLILSIAIHAQEYPLTLVNKFGTTVIKKKPVRVASIDFSGADDLLALGIQPVAIRRWQGKSENGLWPWASALLTSKPVIIGRTIDAELLATTKPDVIIALWSGISQKDYDQLSKIAPVVAVPKEVSDYAMRWEDRAKIAGLVVGKEKAAIEMVDAIHHQMDSIRQAHPNWQKKTAVVAYDWFGKMGGYTTDDIRMQILMAFGFSPFPALQSLAKAGEVQPGKFHVDISAEAINKLDADLLIWVTHGNQKEILSIPGRNFLKAVRDKHEIILDSETTAALSYGSLLSIPYVFKKLVPEIEQVFAEYTAP